MSPMFNACGMNAGNTGPPPSHLGAPSQLNGPPNLNLNEPTGFYSANSGAPPPPHFQQISQSNQPQVPQPHPINFNNQIPRNIAPRPNFCSPVYEFKIFELTKRLSERPEMADHQWWDQFVSEFFDDHSTLTIKFSLDDGPKQQTIGRTLIPRYFRTIFEDGVQDFSIRLKRPLIKELPNRTATLECDQCTLITQHSKPGGYNKQLMHYPGMDPLMMKENKEIGLIVTTEGRLVLEFIHDHDLLRIKTWNFTTTHFQEFILKNLVAMHAQQDSNMLEQLTKNVTRQGLTSATVNYLRLCVLLEPMQLLMTRQKEAEGSSPRDCLQNVLFTKWQTNICVPQEQQRPQSKRRKRKSSTPNNTTGGGSKKKNNTQMSPGTPNFPLATQDVMVVGEPSLMGGEFGDEDERVITRLENSQYDPSTVPTNGLEENDFTGGNNLQPNTGPPSNQPPQSSQNQQQQLNPNASNQPSVNNQLNNNCNNQWSGPQQATGLNGPGVNQMNNNQLNNNSSNNGQSIQGNGVSLGSNQSSMQGSIEEKKTSPISQ